MELTISDIFANKSLKWKLGEVKLWFKEGQEKTSNKGVKSQFTKQEQIKYVHEPNPDESKKAIFVSFY